MLQETSPVVEEVSRVTQQEACMDPAVLNHMKSGARGQVLGASVTQKKRGGICAEESIKLLY